MPEDSSFPFGGGLTVYSDEESEDDKDSENDDGITLRWWVNRIQRRKRQLMKEKIRKDDDKIALRWRSTGNSDESEHDEKMTGEREQRGDLIPRPM